MTEQGGTIWDELRNSGPSWRELRVSGLKSGELGGLSVEEVQAFVVLALAGLVALSQDELAELETGLRDGSLAPYMVDPGLGSRVRSVARAIWLKVGPTDRGQVVAYLGLLAAVVPLVQAWAPHDERPIEVHIEVTTPPSPSPSGAPSPPVVRLIPVVPPRREDGGEEPKGT